MSSYLDKCDKGFVILAKKIGHFADENGYKVYIVGGVVRDILLGKKNLDLDITVEGDCLTFAKKIAVRLKAQLKIYEQFQTATLTLKDGVRIDLAMTRQEKYASAAVLPEVSPGSINDDLFRRDFTINAMAIVINKERFGELIDLYKGSEDLNNKCIRILHPRSFIDDPTRILRAVRFEQRLGFQIEAKTLRCLKDSIRKNLDLKVKPPRHFAEFKKFFLEADVSKHVARIKELRGVRVLDSRGNIDLETLNVVVERVKIIRQNKDYDKAGRWWPIYFFSLLEKKNTHQLEKLSKEVQLDNFLSLSLMQIRECQSVIRQLTNKAKRDSEIYQLLKPFTELALLYFYARTDNGLVIKRIDDFVSIFSHITLDVNGDDLKKMGYPSTDVIGQALELLLLKKIDKKLAAKKDELKEAQILLKRRFSRNMENMNGTNRSGESRSEEGS